jgi:hypothetical protein
VASIALEYLMVVAFLDRGDTASGGAGVWLALVAAVVGAGASVWATIAAEPDVDEPALSPATTMCIGLGWGGMIAFLLLDFLDTLENISNHRISDEFAGDARMINVVVIAAAVGIGLAPKIVRSMRGTGRPAGVSAWAYAPTPGSRVQAHGMATQPVSALAAAGAYAATATQVIAPPAAPALEPRLVVMTRYNGVVVWDDWRNLVNPLERLAANAQLDVVGQVEGYFEVQAGGRRGFVAKGAVR